MSRADTIALIRAAITEHENYWRQERPMMRRLRDIYAGEFWSTNRSAMFDEGSLRVQTSDAYSFVESYVASLFTRSPAVEVAHDASAAGDPATAAAAVNAFMHRQREAIEQCSRLALIYPMAFLRLAPQESTDLLNRVAVRAVPPWEVILDTDAGTWDEQRFIGHRYYLPLKEAREKFGAKQFRPVSKTIYFEPDDRTQPNAAELPEAYKFVELVEMFDMQQDRLSIWSPCWKDGEDLLISEPIPVRSYDNRPLPTIIPLYYSSQPENTLRGYSTLSRVYDQMVEKNIYRTFFANATRRAARQFIVKRGAFDDEAMAKICSGYDGAYAETDSPEPLSTLIAPVPLPPLSADLTRYLNQIENDLQRASLLSPAMRGEATKATATEVTALAQYAASEIGRLARERDGALEVLAMTYVRTLYLLADDDELSIVSVKGRPHVVTPERLDGRFRYAALDQAATPLSDALKRQQFLSLLPVLSQTGVPPEAIREYLIREYDLPKDFNPPPAAPVDTATLRQAPEAVDQAGDPTGRTGAETLVEQLTSAGV